MKINWGHRSLSNWLYNTSNNRLKAKLANLKYNAYLRDTMIVAPGGGEVLQFKVLLLFIFFIFDVNFFLYTFFGLTLLKPNSIDVYLLLFFFGPRFKWR